MPSPAGSTLYSVAATSAGNAWAVGWTASSTHTSTLIVRWNGTAWKRVPSPSPGKEGYLDGLNSVAATSARDAWAVGCTGYAATGCAKAIILQWNGTAWKQAPSPGLGVGPDLEGVAATSARDVWAVGFNSAVQAIILHWNGTAWKRVPSPPEVLSGVAATSATNAWAVALGGVTLHWNGTAWLKVPNPSPPCCLYAVAATSARSAWAVGGRSIPPSTIRTLILHWNGKTWS